MRSTRPETVARRCAGPSAFADAIPIPLAAGLVRRRQRSAQQGFRRFLRTRALVRSPSRIWREGQFPAIITRFELINPHPSAYLSHTVHPPRAVCVARRATHPADPSRQWAHRAPCNVDGSTRASLRAHPVDAFRCGSQSDRQVGNRVFPKESPVLPSFSPALLALADGTVFRGYSIGAPGHTIGEVVFNTAITGYQKS